jgi:predicted small lipoprotein YifL
MEGMKTFRNLTLVALLILPLSGCGYQGFYRYPCQNPDNWKNAECNPPICEASGTCTKDMIKIDMKTDVNLTGGTNNG